MQHLVSSIHGLAWPAVSLAALQAALLCAAWWWAFRWHRRPGLVVRVALIVLSVRFVLFATPVSWFVYYTALGQEYVDPRERDIIGNKVKAFLAPPPQRRYLAVGSSQTYAIYSEFSKANPLVGYYVLAGMSPMDYFDEYDAIRREKPGTILLFVSEFDLARRVDLDNARLSDLPVSQWPSFYRLAAAVDGPSAATHAVIQMAVATLVPEAAYSFVAADGARQLMGWLTGQHASLPSRAEQYHAHMVSLAELDARYIPDQARFLDAFLRRAEQDAIPVVIVAGQYNPDAYSAANQALYRDKVQPLLTQLQQSHPSLTVIDRSHSMQFSTDDYTDGYHIDIKKGPAFVSSIVEALRP